mmetsp:Transcript_14889/g.45081  ORF Transcript_14889/g.45081 Transcript_14889/m.45081 type:complete len:100 (+) Transcript_14889:130-429(+)
MRMIRGRQRGRNEREERAGRSASSSNNEEERRETRARSGGWRRSPRTAGTLLLRHKRDWALGWSEEAAGFFKVKKTEEKKEKGADVVTFDVVQEEKSVC